MINLPDRPVSGQILDRARYRKILFGLLALVLLAISSVLFCWQVVALILLFELTLGIWLAWRHSEEEKAFWVRECGIPNGLRVYKLLSGKDKDSDKEMDAILKKRAALRALECD